MIRFGLRQGQTRNHYLVFSFMQEDETDMELPFTEEVLFVLVFKLHLRIVIRNYKSLMRVNLRRR